MPVQRLDDGSFRHFVSRTPTATAIDNNFIIGVGWNNARLSSPSPIRVLLPISMYRWWRVLNQSSYRFVHQRDRQFINRRRFKTAPGCQIDIPASVIAYFNDPAGSHL